jgi:hypothetical protein
MKIILCQNYQTREVEVGWVKPFYPTAIILFNKTLNKLKYVINIELQGI